MNEQTHHSSSKKLTTQEIRERFVSYFERQNHKRYPSSSLVPVGDATLLFTNAGMVPFKDAFTGKSKPADRRVVTLQKCVRAGGKHNDLENVGFTSRHHTFFEMMGNFSFGDYFKKEAIHFAWEFLTKEVGISKEKLYVTVHHSDEEAARIWHEQEKVPKERIFFRGDKDNFWEMGDVGPCGPCSEIFYDHGEAYSDKNLVHTAETTLLDDEQRYIEIWNLVFMQYERYKENGEVKQRALPTPSVDTGAGFERLVGAVQGIYNNFDTDVFSGIIKKIEQLSGKKYSDHPHWMRVVADHARSTTMLLADGVIPGNDGRGYVLRRIIRRAVRHLDLLGVTTTAFYQLAKVVIESLGPDFSEVEKDLSFIEKYLRLEEEGFRRTLVTGLRLLEKEMRDLASKGKKCLGGKEAFMLYDTHGFPADLTEMILKEQGFTLDQEGFDREMNEQRERSRKSGQFDADSSDTSLFYRLKEAHGETLFVGYLEHEAEATLLGVVSMPDGASGFVFDRTPFYAEGGGQLGDRGEIFDHEHNLVAVITDTKRPIEGLSVHIGTSSTALAIGKRYQLVIDRKNRALTMAHHTATHLLQAALTQVLGSHVKQAGSSVGPGRLRFDFTHHEAPTKAQLARVEKLVNEQIQRACSVTPEVMSKDQAMSRGAVALFGEKYGDSVRVIDIPGFSTELCGGTHVTNTADIGLFKIVQESSLASGVRRLEAVASSAASLYMEQKLHILETIEGLLQTKGEQLIQKTQSLLEEARERQLQVQSLKEKIQTLKAQTYFEGVQTLSSGAPFKHISLEAEDDLQKMGDLFMDKFSKGVVLVTQVQGEKLSLLLKTFKGNQALNCSEALRSLVGKWQGKGGGRPDSAQGSVDLKHGTLLIQEALALLLK
jgi:alanyl-tRNA synthetase